MKGILYLFFISLCSFSVFGNEQLVVIAFPKEAKISDKSCTHYLKDKSQYCDDGVIELKYEIDEMLYGHYEKDTIDIIDFVHKSGFPSYITKFPVVFLLEKKNGYYILVRDTYIVDMVKFEGVCLDGFELDHLSVDIKPLYENNGCKIIADIADFKSLLSTWK